MVVVQKFDRFRQKIVWENERKSKIKLSKNLNNASRNNDDGDDDDDDK